MAAAGLSARKVVTMKFAACTASVALVWLGGTASADEGGFDHAVPKVERSFQIAFNGGYSQGTGELGDGMQHVEDLSGPGGGGELKLGFRAIAPLTIGVFGGCWPLGSSDVTAMSGTSTTATAGLFADWHFRVDRSVVPWVGLSTGWRGFWVLPDEGDTTSMHGLEIARLQLGVDYRLTPGIAIAPMIGASMAMFLTQEAPGTSGYERVSGSQVTFFFFGGLQARFDLFGTRVTTREP
jgi:hypothetical protein